MRVRLLPVVLFAGGLLLTVKVGGLWQDLSLDAGSDSVAQTAPAGTTSAAGQAPPPASAESPAAAPAADTGASGTAPAGGAPAGETATGTDLLAPGSASDPLSYSDQELELLQSLAKRRDELDRRERGLEEQTAMLAATEKRLDDKLAELKQLQAAIEGMVKQHDADQEAQLASLVKIYENMKPKDAAQIFGNLEMDVLLDVVDRMKERKVAPILALMKPEKAQEVTLELAQRRKLPLPQ